MREEKQHYVNTLLVYLNEEIEPSLGVTTPRPTTASIKDNHEQRQNGGLIMKIYCFIDDESTGLLHVVAVSAEGTAMCGHLSSSVGFAKHDIGITSEWKHDIYKEVYPDGYELVWVDEPYTSKEVKDALQKNRPDLSTKEMDEWFAAWAKQEGGQGEVPHGRVEP